MIEIPKLFHCTDSREAAEHILTNGYSSSLEMLLNMNPLIHAFDQIPKSIKAKELPLPPRASGDEAERHLDKEGAKLFGHGTAIWTSELPLAKYGDYCFLFKPPKGSIAYNDGAGESGVNYWGVWVPLQPIPPRSFRLLGSKEIDALWAAHDGEETAG